jgi:hypothetical protein
MSETMNRAVVVDGILAAMRLQAQLECALAVDVGVPVAFVRRALASVDINTVLLPQAAKSPASDATVPCKDFGQSDQYETVAALTHANRAEFTAWVRARSAAHMSEVTV